MQINWNVKQTPTDISMTELYYAALGQIHTFGDDLCIAGQYLTQIPTNLAR